MLHVGQLKGWGFAPPRGNGDITPGPTPALIDLGIDEDKRVDGVIYSVPVTKAVTAGWVLAPPPAGVKR